jgi:hypothetical protein
MEAEMQAEGRAWKFDRGNWGEVEEHVFRLIADGQAKDLSGALFRAGYRTDPILQIGEVQEHGLSAEVYAAGHDQASEYPYYIVVSLVHATECVYIPDFPSLLMFLSQFGTIFGGVFYGGVS